MNHQLPVNSRRKKMIMYINWLCQSLKRQAFGTEDAIAMAVHIHAVRLFARGIMPKEQRPWAIS